MCIWCGAYTELMSTLARRSSILTHLTLALQPVGYIDGRSPRGHSGELLVILVGASRVTRCWLVPGACISSSNITFIVSISSCLASLAIQVQSDSQTSLDRHGGSFRARASPASLTHVLPPPLTHARLA